MFVEAKKKTGIYTMIILINTLLVYLLTGAMNRFHQFGSLNLKSRSRETLKETTADRIYRREEDTKNTSVTLSD